jgi:hypothetical protein
MSRKQSAKISDHFDDPVPMMHTKRAIFRFIDAKDSPKNRPAISGIASPGRRGAKTPEYLIFLGFHNAGGRDVSAPKRLRYF